MIKKYVLECDMLSMFGFEADYPSPPPTFLEIVCMIFSFLDIIFFCTYLQVSRKDLLALDFEGVLKYFRVQLPKRFRTEEATSELMQTAVSCKVKASKLKKYDKEYLAMKEEAMQKEDPVERLEVGGFISLL